MGRFRLPFALALMVACAVGCFHYPDEAMLLALGHQPEDYFFENPQPKYLGFDDERSAFVLAALTRSGRYQLAPEETSLICPGVAANGMHGYMLRVGVDTVMGDSAVVTLYHMCTRDPQRCSSGATSCVTPYSGTAVSTTSYLLRRKYGQWTVVKPLNGSVRTPG